ncbi:uncharacterized protein LOC135682880 [Rhopilema esculentum]|uniref:uncharacterized protein LOC135682880 n=1 Tax=Rhopilema esculentum TaxID=499914 RepID=UPI0031D33726
MILDILLRFRIHKVAIAGDIEKAFLNIEIPPEQGDFLRFLWVNDVSSENPELIKLRFTRLVFGLTSSPFVLNATLRKHIMTEGKNDPLFVYNTLRSLYVDDYQSSFSTNNEAFETYRKLKDSLHKVGFNMRKWVTNNKELKERIKKHEALYTPVSENANVLEDPNHEQPDTKVLGIGWNLITDSLKLDFEKIVRDTSITMVTKRSILCTTAKFYDPLGLISPVILPLKCLFQELCKIKENWDSPVHDKIAQKFRDIILDIRSVSKIELPRSVMHEVEVSDIKSVQLHGFSDASTVAYAASVYLRVETSSRVVSHLIASKTRVSPLKSESVPRLELMGALILARLMKTVSDALSATLNIDQTFCWSDSQIVIWWIFGENKTFKQYVQNRIKVVLDPEDDFSYVFENH